MTNTSKGYRGIGMDGAIARWYAKNMSRDLTRFRQTADAVTERAPTGSRILEVAPGPGFCAIELAKTGRYRVTGVDISETFVRIAGENAKTAGVDVDFRHGNASAMPFDDASFDVIVCSAAFKNFRDPLGALNECYRVLAPGGQASIYDLRKDASREDIAAEVRSMHLSAVNAWLTIWTFRTVLLKRAYTREALERMAATSRFGAIRIDAQGIGFELRLTKAA
jgi:ubiquinone/menaquinone biosynthesis C-methylase UbiE